MSLLRRQYPKMTEIAKISVGSIHFDDVGRIAVKISDKATSENLEKAASLIKSNHLVGFPTETVYGLGGSALNDGAVTSIFRAKNRPADNPLIVHVSSYDQLDRLIRANSNSESIPEIYKPLIEKFWPGPLSILLPIDIKAKKGPYKLSNLVTNNQDTVAVRFPSDPVARALIALSDTPIAAPSANTSTKPSPTLANHVYNDLKGKIPLILDGGNCNIGLESTVINGLVSPPTLLRPGGLSIKAIKQIKGFENLTTELTVTDDKTPVRTPGMKYKHYSPDAEVALIIKKTTTKSVYDAKEYLDFAAKFEDKTVAVVSQSHLQGKPSALNRDLGDDIKDIQFNMFRILRELDTLKVGVIFIVIDEATLADEDGLAVVNRLSKAASQKVYI